MNRLTITLDTPADRDKAIEAVRRAPDKTRVQFAGWRRTIPQNDRLWSMLSDIAKQVEWYGQKLSKEDWKLIFLDALNRETRPVPNIDGTGYLDLSKSSSDLSRTEMSDMLELIAAFGAQRNVKFKVFGEQP
jgi:hypothetical protein